MNIIIGWFMVGFIAGLFCTIMIAVLTVEHRQEEEAKEHLRQMLELDEEIKRTKERLKK